MRNLGIIACVFLISNFVSTFSFAQNSTCQSALDAKQQAQQSSNDAQTAMVVSGVATYVGCGTGEFSGPTLCYAGLAGVVISGIAMSQSNSTDSGSNPIIQQHCTPNSVVSDNTPTPPDPVSLTNAALQKAGVTFDPKTGTFTLPNGSTVSKSSLLNGGAGMSAADKAGFQSAFADLQNKIKEKIAEKKNNSGGAEDIAGGGGSGSTPPAYTPPTTPELPSANGAGLPNRTPTSVAGMSKLLNGEPIGVAGDSLFKMVGRRYNMQAQAKSLLVGP